MKPNRFTPNSGEIFRGEKPEVIGPLVDPDKVLDILIGQLKLLNMLACPAIYIPTEESRGLDGGKR